MNRFFLLFFTARFQQGDDFALGRTPAVLLVDKQSGLFFRMVLSVFSKKDIEHLLGNKDTLVERFDGVFKRTHIS